VGLAQWAHEQKRWKLRTLAFLLGSLLAPLIYLGAAAWAGDPGGALPAAIHEDLRGGVVPGQYEDGADAPPAVWHVMAQPREWARGLVWKAARSLDLLPRPEVPWEKWALWHGFLLMMVLGLSGTLLSLARTEWRLLLPQVAVLLPFAAMLVFLPLPGLQLLQVPALIALACYGAHRTCTFWGQKRFGRVQGVAGLVSIVGVVWYLALYARLHWL
jgi:hypothetical protein